MNPLDVSIERLRTRTSMKWRQYPADVLPLWVAEMDVELAEPVVAAVTEAVYAGDTGYPLGVAEYAQALASFAEDRWGWSGIAAERSAIVADVMVGVTEVLRLITSPGDGVVVNCPVYPPFYAFVEHAGRRVVEAPLSARHRLDLDMLERVFADARPAAYLLCSPHNPTGTVHTADELAAAYLLEHARVALNAGATFGSGGAGHGRLNFGTSRTILTEAIDRIAAALPT